MARARVGSNHKRPAPVVPVEGAVPEPATEPATDTAPVPRTEDGKFLPGVSGNPNGRPKGVRNRITLARLLLEEGLRSKLANKADRILEKAMDLALAGDEKLLRAFLDKLLTTPKDAPDEGADNKDIKVIIQNLTAPGAVKVIAARPTQTIDQ